jgi:hypothetical protein
MPRHPRRSPTSHSFSFVCRKLRLRTHSLSRSHAVTSLVRSHTLRALYVVALALALVLMLVLVVLEGRRRPSQPARDHKTD